MKPSRSVFPRLMQYLGVAVASHAITMHMVVLRYFQSGKDSQSHIAKSWAHLCIGIVLALAIFWIGFSMERRFRKTDSSGERPIAPGPLP